ncbi:aromatic ring-opening dioxygenase LigA [Streptomyces sp. MUSC 125]|uniref:Acg family FMN-binding oxidoreductase n=1 Tax=Streptomyces sp. MUSC 125 TaxID=1428624 RepID=UPI00057D3E43|nr:nitroreductase family protein [Streptomyces sp. MUSC 125]KIE26833.1 aromatic ring-opening dioxygenase LigA [Streptomyces sp. MUSC 125]
MSSTTLDTSALEKLLAAAVAAPSMHNTQPWRFRLDAGSSTVEIRAVPERSLPQEDPYGRAVHIAAGAALLNLRVAAGRLGWTPVSRLLPDPRDPTLLVAVRLQGRGGPRDAREADLYDAIPRRHSSRMPFTERAVPLAVLAELADASHAEGARLTVAGEDETARLLRLSGLAEHRNHTDPDRAAESRRWTGGEGGRDTGIPARAFGPRDAGEHVPVRDFCALRQPDRLPSLPFERHPMLVALSTTHDHRADWLRAGQALERVLLLATVHGLRTSLLHQALEWPDLRSLLRAPDAPYGHVQMIVRLGYGPEGPATPRRTPHLFLATADDGGLP